MPTMSRKRTHHISLKLNGLCQVRQGSNTPTKTLIKDTLKVYAELGEAK